ncbi:type II secretion system protein N [Halopseudomonas salegens]|uniref:Type II secretion system protein N n=1 Tax=Halopseudomonas salegens TaxID=1434072 RepID=A0A1H2GB11_9GAMM|nr:type II secretion system protein N [Halopseudomonas salegens]SDU16827.1 type II secretion system protein N (GspN) [Halopseudomonas salegens]
MKGPGVKLTLGLAFVLYLLALLWQLPASIVWQRIAPDLPANVELEGLNGTLWQGQVARMTVNGVDQGGLKWDWRPMGLLRGNIALDLLWQPRNGEVSAHLLLGTSRIQLQDVSGELDAASMAEVNRAPFILAGSWLLDVPRLELIDLDQVSAAEGRLVWQGAAGGLPQPLALGHLSATLGQRDGWLTLDLQDQGGPLGLQGDARWRPGQPMYLDTRLQARADAEPGLAGGLQMLGQPNAQGWIQWQAQLQ